MKLEVRALLVCFVLFTAACCGQTAATVTTNAAGKSVALTIQLQQSQPQAAGALLEWTKALSPIAAAIVGVVGVAITAIITISRGFFDARYAYAAETLRYRIRQLQEFYAPMLLQVEKSRRLYRKLLWTIQRERPAFKLDGFRLLDHIATFSKEGFLQKEVADILKTGESMCNLITKKAGLIEGGVSEPYIEYIAHHTILKAASEGSVPPTIEEGWHREGYYPRMLNREVRQGYKVVVAHMKDYVNASDTVIKRLLTRGDLEVPFDHMRLLENISFYECHAKTYASKYDTFDISQIRNRFLGEIPKPTETEESILPSQRRQILDAGCGTGRDTAEFLKHGCVVTAVDPSPAMVRATNRKVRAFLKQQADQGQNVDDYPSECLEMTFDELSYRSQFDGVWAAASLVHSAPGELGAIVRNLADALRPKGVMYISVKYGRGKQEYDGRTFYFYGRNDFRRMAKQAGVEPIRMWITDLSAKELPRWRQWPIAGLLSWNRSYWLNILLRKEAR